MTARDAVELCGLVRPRTVIPIHYEGWKHFREGREAIERELARRARGRPRARPLAADRGGSRPGGVSPRRSRRRRIRCAREAPVRHGAGRLPRQRAGAPGRDGGVRRGGDRALHAARRPRCRRGGRCGGGRPPRCRRPHRLPDARRRASTSRGRAPCLRDGRRRARLVHLSSDLVFPGTGDAGADRGRRAAARHALWSVQARGRAPLPARARCSCAPRSSTEGSEPGPQERAALDAADGVRQMAFFTDELRCPIAVADLAAAVLELAALDVAGPLHVAGADALTRLEFARLICAHHGRDPEVAARRARRPGAPQADRPGLLAGARPAARAPARRARGAVPREGDRRRRRSGRAVVRRAAAGGRARRRRGRPRPAAGDHLGGGGRALVPLPRLPLRRVTAWSATDLLRARAGWPREASTGVRMLCGHRAAPPPARPTPGGATRCRR